MTYQEAEAFKRQISAEQGARTLDRTFVDRARDDEADGFVVRAVDTCGGRLTFRTYEAWATYQDAVRHRDQCGQGRRQRAARS